MPVIKVSEIIKEDRQKVYAIIKDIRRFPEFMKGVKKINILRQSANRCVTAWEVEVDSATVLWKQEDVFNDEKYRIDFSMLEGDYAQYTGTWDIADYGKGCRVILTVKIDWGAPALVEFIGGILEKKTALSLKGMLLAIKKKAEAA
ncbi:MAG: SRPBCC family protein [Candidatus Omnitrophica bacterium]|nr:SRPBCC family protein [Candidatus Omnitrophota bacterium]MBL7210416.1 SRPBCC family protein [Candidatus Omnitrophota bacterium]